ncbi:outer membrane lipoprotein chaperone LolA [Alteromonas lipolytica]|uniref:Outer-membrane lipoprotein carrier protein n=1 Tax=Alteromonas lipolytica TaxID=1856405 RepID=A0A1E8FIF3_9ALTE|nr:outer membrane lipoprotein chaperone LolA [Alteromonas lipolytica]OFI35253.1 outer membrane lipoprotein carrier protein LolA [Alteromonas lipolytica]GGF58006.1 outer-membrane lipoprotein carrier protein [Alteromonas lipolytica]
MKLFLSRAVLAVSFFAAPVFADDAGELKQRLTDLQSFQAAFSQAVTDEQGEIVHEASGNLTMTRPDKLRWETLLPDETVLIADGTSVWHIDEWVEQVTVMSQQQAVDNNPMVLLTSNDESVWQQYAVNSAQTDNFTVSAKNEGGQIRTLTLSFDEQGLAKLIMVDSQGQQSTITFSQREFNQPVASSAFIAEIPESFMVDDQRP